MFRIKNRLSVRLPKGLLPAMAAPWRTRMPGGVNEKPSRGIMMQCSQTILLVAGMLWFCSAQSSTFNTAFGAGRIAAPSNTATGAILARHYFTPKQICEKDVCEVTRARLYNKGSTFRPQPGPDVETTVDGLSARVLLDGVPMKSNTRQSVRNTVEVQLIRDSRAPKSGPLKPGIVNSYFDIDYKSGLLGETAYIYLEADVNFINGTCSVPNQTVNLPDTSTTSFRGVGSTTAGRAFSLRLTNCPAGYNRVGYQVSPLNGPVSGIPGALQLRPDSTASGVGIKLSDAKTQLPLAFDRSIATPYNGSAAPQIDIPLNAEYVQTAEKITGGTVQAGALVLLDYQ
ncbi:fimbrial protein [Burkholderia stagnalis]|uniref:fimbrial protein n=1 Tax=Burkholderia stagnalis TaxID=1503054 RepID=UPI001E5B4E0E|nr:fimbrial protein [Burkholderia stagnalis]